MRYFQRKFPVDKVEPLTAFLFLLAAVVFLYGWVYYPIVEKHSGDFLKRLRGGWSFDHTWIYWDGKGVDVYGPLFTLMDYYIHEFHLDRLVFLQGLFIFYLLLNLVTAYLLLKIFRFWNGNWLKRAWGVSLIVHFFPLVQAIKQDVIENLQLFAIAAFLYFFSYPRKRRDLLAGASLGLGICAKTFPLALVPYLVLRKYYKLAGAALLFFILVVWKVSDLKGLTLWEGTRGMFLFQHALEALNFHQNQAISGFAYRLFCYFNYDDLSSLTHPRLSESAFISFQVVRYLLILCFLLVTFWRVFPIFWKIREFSAKEFVYLEVSILFAIFLLIVPHTQIHYFILLLPAYLFLFDQFFEFPTPRREKYALIFSYLLVGFKLPLRGLDMIFPSPFACPYIQLTNIWNFPFYGTVILLFLLINDYRRRYRVYRC